MALPKKANDFITIMGFIFAIMVATMLVTGILKYALMLAVFHAMDWSLDRNVEYGMGLAYEAMTGEDEEE